VNLGNMSVAGGNSAPQTVRITNTGQAPLVIGGFTFSGANAGQFNRNIGTCLTGGANALQPGTSCSLTVTFNPTSAGPKTAVLNVSVAAPATNQSVPLTGTGTLP